MITVCQAAELDTPGRLAWARQEKESKTRPNSCSIQPRCGGGPPACACAFHLSGPAGDPRLYCVVAVKMHEPTGRGEERTQEKMVMTFQ